MLRVGKDLDVTPARAKAREKRGIRRDAQAQSRGEGRVAPTSLPRHAGCPGTLRLLPLARGKDGSVGRGLRLFCFSPRLSHE